VLLAQLSHGLSQNVRQIVHFPVYLTDIQAQNDNFVALKGILKKADIYRHLEFCEKYQLHVGHLL